MDRSKKIIQTSIVGIAANVLLSAFKMAVGLISNSIAIVLDSINNLSDALSSVITIIGAKIAGKKPDKQHPFGHGRFEYIAASVIALIILYAGITSFIESVKRIITPALPDYSATALIIVAVAVIIKFLLGKYVERTGKSINSSALIASGKDAILDSAVSLSTLLAAGIFLIWGISTEAYLAAIIALLLVKTSVDILRETIAQILGERAEGELTRRVKDIVSEFDQVYGVYDLILHNYGPDTYVGSVHIEVPDVMSVAELDKLERDIAERVYVAEGVILAGISVYGRNTTNEDAIETRNVIRKIVMSHEYALQFHGFYIDEERKLIQFDVVVDFSLDDKAQACADLVAEVKAVYPDYEVRIVFDNDASDIL